MRYNNTMRKLLLALGLIALNAFAVQYNAIVPKDINNVPIYGGLGIPFSGTATPTANAYDDTIKVAVPLTGVNAGRQYRSISVYNPSLTRTVYVCFGGDAAAGCSDNIIVNPGYAVVLDNVYFGALNDITNIYLKLDSAGTSAVQVQGW